jgi:hypothetical protein
MGSKGAFWPWLLLFFLILGGLAVYLFGGGYLGLPQTSWPRLFGLRPTPALVTPDGHSLRVGRDGQVQSQAGEAQGMEVVEDPNQGEVRIPEFAIGIVRPMLVGRVLTDLEAQGYSEVDRRRELGKEEILLAKEDENFVVVFEQEGEYLRWSVQPSGAW